MFVVVEGGCCLKPYLLLFTCVYSGGGWVLSKAVFVVVYLCLLLLFTCVYSGGGWVLSKAVSRWKGIAVYSPIINGKKEVGGD